MTFFHSHFSFNPVCGTNFTIFFNNYVTFTTELGLAVLIAFT